jgi:hypothetical protein
LFDFLSPSVPTGAFAKQNKATKKATQQQEAGRDMTIEAREHALSSLNSGLQDSKPYFQQASNLFDGLVDDRQGATDMYYNSLGLNGQEGYDEALGAYQQGPGYQFALDEANKNVMRNSASMGGLRSGGTAAALSDRAQQLQNLEFGGWQDRLQGLDVMPALGMQSQGLQNLGNLFNQYGQNRANTYTNFAGPIQQGYGNVAGQHNNNASLIGQQASMQMGAEQQGIANAIGLLGGVSGFFGA